MIPPATRTPARWIALGLATAAVLIALVSTSQLYFNWISAGFEANFAELLAADLVEWGMWAAYVPVVVAVERRYGFAVHTWRRAVPAHVLSALAFFALQNAAMTGFTLLADPVAAGDPFGVAYARRALAKLAPTLVVYGAVVGGWWILYLLGERHRHAMLSARLRADLSDARLLSLKMQIHPHFLFNTLHTIAGLVREGDRDLAVATLEELSELLRRALRDVELQEVPLREELDFLDRYLRIQQLRFGDMLRVEKQVDAAALDALVPSLLLQPVVENAIAHGLDFERGPGCVRITAEREGADVVLRVTDNGAGLPAGALREGVGLSTTRSRLDQLHGGRARLDAETLAAGGAAVTIRIPFRDTSPSSPAAIAYG